MLVILTILLRLFVDVSMLLLTGLVIIKIVLLPYKRHSIHNAFLLANCHSNTNGINSDCEEVARAGVLGIDV